MSEENYSSEYHAPVLVEEVLHWLDADDAKFFVDGTAGGGGHTQAILEASAPDGRVLALDRDPRAVTEVSERLGDADGRLTLVEANYGDTAQVLRELDLPRADGWLIDAGVSSHQFDEPDRGFSFRFEGPLDMRMGPEAMTVAEFLDNTDIEEFAKVLRDFGEMSGSWRLARVILEARERGEMETTKDLAELVKERRQKPPWAGGSSIHPATLVFQALRIAVNRELDHLKAAVESIPDVVAAGGRAVFISFHSLEDRIVKHGFRNLADPCVCPPDFPVCGCGNVPLGEVLTRKPVMASDEESQKNPRARSAKLRAFRVFSEEEASAIGKH